MKTTFIKYLAFTWSITIWIMFTTECSSDSIIIVSFGFLFGLTCHGFYRIMAAKEREKNEKQTRYKHRKL